MLAGEDAASAATEASRVMALETELAKASSRRVDLREPAATDHPMSVAELARSSRRTSTGRRTSASIGLAATVDAR